MIDILFTFVDSLHKAICVRKRGKKTPFIYIYIYLVIL